jgi:hypothetical protein
MTQSDMAIFSDTERDYCYLSRVTRYRSIHGGARFSVLTNTGEAMSFEVGFLSPCIVRARCFRPDEKPPLTSAVFLEGSEPGAGVDVEARQGKVIITSSALELRVVCRPFHYGVFDLAGEKLFVQQIGDVAGDRLVSLPMGYSHDAAGSVAFHESFELAPDERLYGPGDQNVDRRGEGSLTNIDSSFFLSSHGYGVFVHASSNVVWELGAPSPITCSFRVEDPCLDYLLIFGDGPDDILTRYAKALRLHSSI